MSMFSEFRSKVSLASRSEDGFMGYTHALSALAVILICVAFIPEFIPNIVGNDNVWVVIMFVLGGIGASMIPDLDNTTSRAKSDLGFFGVILSGVFRVSSSAIQTLIRTKRDDPDPNPHRGFWHTIPAALLLGGLTFLATLGEGEIDVPLFGTMAWGTLIAMLIVAVLINLTLSTLLKEFMDKLRKSEIIGELVAALVSLSFSAVLFYNIPKDENFWWLGVAVAMGMTIHTLGDCFTTAGAPILFPLSALIKGKFWWTTRFTKIKAGGPAEKMLFVPLFAILACVAIVKIVFDVL